jgi:hypothetical protein
MSSVTVVSSRPAAGRLLWIALVAGLVFGLVYRLVPLALGPDWLAQFFITEDGYLMLTVARNIALGNGLSVSGGEIATNGVQPLGTFLYTLPYLLTGGDKLGGIAGVMAIMAAVSVVALVAIRAFAARVLGPAEDPRWAWLVALLWFLGPLFLFHSMNALETGLSTLAVVALLLWFGHLSEQGRPFSLADKGVLGVLAGLAFLARIDCAFLVTAVFAVHLVRCLADGGGIRRAVGDLLLPGILSLVLAAPWLLYNRIGFGSVMPISGTAQSVSAGVGDNLPLLPSKLFETMFPMLPVPASLETSLPVMILASLVVPAVLVAFGVLLWRQRRPFHAAVVAYGLHGLALAVYYGAFFGAPHFLSRYLAPLAPLLVIAALVVALALARRLFRQGDDVVAVLGTAALGLSVALLGVKLARGPEQGHFQVVDWVQANVPAEVWVGAVQTGTLGYWHDRTINLDGKVNPEALAARVRDGSVLGYVVAGPIEVIADWVGIAGWMDMDETFARTFEVVLVDPARNLAVLKRRADAPAG